MDPNAWLQGFTQTTPFRAEMRPEHQGLPDNTDGDDRAADAPATDVAAPPRSAPAKQPSAPPAGGLGTRKHRVWLSVWWPDAQVDVEAALSAALPEDLPDAVFGPIPANLRPAVAYAVLREQVASFSDARRTRDAVGFELTEGQWAMVLPVSVTDVGACDLAAVFTVGTDRNGFPEAYTFSDWVTPDNAAALVAATHRAAPDWRVGSGG